MLFRRHHPEEMKNSAFGTVSRKGSGGKFKCSPERHGAQSAPSFYPKLDPERTILACALRSDRRKGTPVSAMPARNHQGSATPRRHASILLAALAAVAALGSVVAARQHARRRPPGPAAALSAPTTGGTSTSRPRRSIPRRPATSPSSDRRETLHPDFGGDVSPGSAQIYGFPYAVVDSTVTPRDRAVSVRGRERRRRSRDESAAFPFYPIPDEAITQAHWIEGGEPGQRRPAQQQRSPPAHRRSRSPLSVRALQRVLRRQPVARRLRRVLRPERERPAAGRLDVGRRRRAGDSAGARALRRGVRARRDRSRVSRDGAGDERLRVSGVAPRGLDDRRAADGRAAAAEGEPQHLRRSRRRCRRSSARCSATA